MKILSMPASAISKNKIIDGANSYYSLTTQNATLTPQADCFQINCNASNRLFVNGIDVTDYNRVVCRIKAIDANNTVMTVVNNGSNSAPIAINTETVIAMDVSSLTGTIRLDLAWSVIGRYNLYELYLE